MEHAVGMSVSEIRLAGVYLEKILKQTDSSIWMRPKTFRRGHVRHVSCFGTHRQEYTIGLLRWDPGLCGLLRAGWSADSGAWLHARPAGSWEQEINWCLECMSEFGVGIFYHFYRAGLLWVSFTPFQTSYFSYLRLLRAGMGSDCSTGQMLGFLRPFVSVDLLLQNTCVFPAHQTWWLVAFFQSGNWWPGGGSSAKICRQYPEVLWECCFYCSLAAYWLADWCDTCFNPRSVVVLRWLAACCLLCCCRIEARNLLDSWK